MNVLVIGGGGREHALVAGLARSARVGRVYCVSGNAGTESLAENISGDIEDLDFLVGLGREREIGLTVVGPEGPLCAGIVDRFEAAGLPIFGPSAAAARIEGDKAYAKQLMKHAHVPTAEARIFERYNQARDYVASRDHGVVVKAAGLAAGKGVSVCDDPSDGLIVLEKMMVEKQFGDAGKTVVVEEILQGPEVSIHALVCGHTIYVLDSAQDHKRANDGDTGPNTGGMGAYSPAPVATDEVIRIVERDVLVPIVDAMENDGAPFRGVLYAGMMLTPGGPKVLEFNCRFGDPEAQVLLSRLESDLAELLLSVVHGRLEEAEVRWNPKPAVCVVMASGGYPGDFAKGKPISGLETAGAMPDVHVFHAGTRRHRTSTGDGAGDQIVTSGGRVLGVTGLGNDIAAAKRRAYEAVETIHFDGAHFRRDISDKAMRTARANC